MPLAESDRHFGGRVLPEDGVRGLDRAFETRYVMAAGERRPLYFAFRNEGGDTWPWDHVAGPPMSASYHWRDARGRCPGALRLAHGVPAPVPPGVEVRRAPHGPGAVSPGPLHGSRWTPSRSTSAGSATRCAVTVEVRD